MKTVKIALTVLLAAPVLALGIAFVLCGYLGGFCLLFAWIAGSAIWRLWRHPLSRRYLAGYCAVALMLSGAVWAAVPRLSFRQVQGRALALPENAAAEALAQAWRDRLLSSVPDTAKNRLTGKGYFVLVAEGPEVRSYFVHPSTGAVYLNPTRQAGHFRP